MPQLPAVVEKLEDVAEPVRQFYVAKDSKFALDLAGAPVGFVPAADLATANGKVIEFRDNNVKLVKEVEELRPIKTAFEGIDAKTAREAIAAHEELKKRGITKPDDVAALRAEILKDVDMTIVKPLREQLTQLTSTSQADRKRADDLTLRTTLGDKFNKAGGELAATDFIVSRAAGVFKVEDGKLVAEANQFSADRPGEPLSVEEWLTRQTKESPFAFKSSSGGGANPITGNGGPSRPAGQLVLKDPTAQQLGQHAGDIKSGKMRVEYSEQK